MTGIGVIPLNAAGRLEVQFEEMAIPISISQLIKWVKEGDAHQSELTYWLNLLDPESREGLAKLLEAPLIKDQSMARQILRSWMGRKLLDEISDFFRIDDNERSNRVFNTLEELLELQTQVSTLDLLEALPGEIIQLDLDELLNLAGRLRDELKKQQKLAFALGSFPSNKLQIEEKDTLKFDFKNLTSEVFSLEVNHRSDPLKIEYWSPSKLNKVRSGWIIFMPGLGGSQDHFRWLAKNLSKSGWPVLLLEHPGSDTKAVQALIEGVRPAPGAEVLIDRLKDLNSVISAKSSGELQVPGSKLVIMGHSLGALTALLASGATPVQGLSSRCNKALDDLSLTNLSQLLQCQLVEMSIPLQEEIPELHAIVAINSFGSLLWPEAEDAKISVPVLLAGGTLDLITPPISEQLRLLIATSSHPFSRTLLVEGASHFSPIRVEGQVNQTTGDDLLQLGEAFVGVQPIDVQRILAEEIISFLNQLQIGEIPGSSIHEERGNLRLHLLDRLEVEKLLNTQ